MSSIIFDQYAERLNRLKRHQSTKHGFQRSREELEKYLTEVGLDPVKVDSHDLEEYFAQLPYAVTTKKLHLAHIGAAYRYAQRRGLVPRDPTVDVQIERVPDKEPRTIPNAELREIKAKAVTDREWMIFHMLAYTGMRRKEVLDAKWSDVKIEENTITVVGKGGKLRHVPIHPVLGEVFTSADQTTEYILAGRWNRQTADKTLWELLRHMTDGRYTPHDFRRTVASSLYANGVDGDTIDKIMGWSPRVVRTRYYQAIAGPQLQRAILKLYRDDPI